MPLGLTRAGVGSTGALNATWTAHSGIGSASRARSRASLLSRARRWPKWRPPNEAYHTHAQREKAASKMDPPSRGALERSGALIDSLGLHAGGTIADVGTSVGHLLPYITARRTRGASGLDGFDLVAMRSLGAPALCG